MSGGVLMLDRYPKYCDECQLRYGDHCVVVNLNVGEYIDYLEKYENCPIKEVEDNK